MLDTKGYKLVGDRLHLVDTLLDGNTYAEKILAGGKVINVITKEIYEADVAITGEYILMIGDCSKLKGPKTEIVDVSGKHISPGFIDAHMHFESAMLTGTEFSRISLPTGTTCLVSDPHEIGNVLGKVGMKAMADEAKTLPQHVYLRVPAQTPDSPGLETAGENITSKDVPEMLEWETVTGIGEIQGVTTIGFVYKHNYELIKDTIASTTYARSIGKQVDGNIAGLFGEELAAHIICGGTDISCHETTTKEEAMEKLRYGVYILMREGSTQYNMADSIRAITEEGFDYRRAIIATDDMLPEDIINKGHMDDIIKRTIKEGVDPIEAVQMATINPATWLGLSEIGVLAPGKYADIAIIDGKLEDMDVTQVFLKGEEIAKDGDLLIDLPEYTYPDTVKTSVKRDPITAEDLMIAAEGNKVSANCIGYITRQNLTEKVQVELPVENGYVKSNDENLLPVAVVGRHGQVDIGKSFIHGFDLKEGAFAETVSHDTHNIIVIGTNYEDMAIAVNRVIELQGGIVLAKDGEVINELPLRVSGLMTDELSAHDFVDQMTKLHKEAEVDLKCSEPAPFMHLSFLSLSTSPKWKITDKGVIDVENYKVIPSIEPIK